MNSEEKIPKNVEDKGKNRGHLYCQLLNNITKLITKNEELAQ